MPDAGQTRAYLALTLISALWGSYPAFAKLALVAFPPFVLVALRGALASAFLTVLLFRRGWEEFRELRGTDVRTFAFLGFTGLFVSTGGTYLGIALSTAANAAILQAGTPVMVALGARFYLKERLRRRQWAGVAASIAGVLLVITRGSWRAIAHLELLPGDFILLLSQAGWSAYTIYGKQVLALPRGGHHRVLHPGHRHAAARDGGGGSVVPEPRLHLPHRMAGGVLPGLPGRGRPRVVV